MMPDLFHHALCGSTCGEYTIASTTQLLDVRTRRWADDLFSRLGLPRELMPELVPPGTPLGELRPGLQKELGWGPCASSRRRRTTRRARSPARRSSRAGRYISSGTWSLLGVERTPPLVNDAVARVNFSERGRRLRDGAFPEERDGALDPRLLPAGVGREGPRRRTSTTSLAAAAAIEVQPGLVYPDHPRFFHPESMTAEIQGALAETGQRLPDDPARLTRVVLDSLAFRYASLVRTIEELTGEVIPGIHIVGGGCRNEYLNQATADATGKPVLAGPVEATAKGSVLVQAVSCAPPRVSRRGPRARGAGRPPAPLRAPAATGLGGRRRALPRDRSPVRVTTAAALRDRGRSSGATSVQCGGQESQGRHLRPRSGGTPSPQTPLGCRGFGSDTNGSGYSVSLSTVRSFGAELEDELAEERVGPGEPAAGEARWRRPGGRTRA